MNTLRLPRALLSVTLALIVLGVAFGAISISSIIPISTTPSLNVSVTQKFNITVNDTVNVTYVWRINGTIIQNSTSPEFLFSPSSTGTAIVTVNATRNNTNESLVQTWTAALIASSTQKAGLSSPEIFVLGSDSQKTSNKASDVSDAHNVYIERTLSIKNTDANSITNITASVSGAGGFNIVDDLNLSLKIPSTTIAGGGNLDITVKTRVPDRLDAVNQSTGGKISPQVAQVTFSGFLSNGTATSSTSSINLQRKNQLVIKDFKVCVSSSDCEDVGTDATVDNVEPGDKVEFEIKVENLYTTREDEDIDIRDVEISYEIDEEEFNEDDNQNVGDLGARDEDTQTFTLDIPDDIDGGIYDVLVILLGTDENGAIHGVREQFQLDINRKAHDIQLRKMTLTPQTVSTCEGSRSFIVSIDANNIGDNDEGEVVLSVRSGELGIDRRYGPFQLDKDSKRQESFTVNLPETARPAEYTLVAKAFFDTDKQTDEEGATVTLKECEGTASSVPNTTTAPAITTPNQTTSPLPQVLTPPPRPSERVFASPTSEEVSTRKGNVSMVVVVLGFILGGLIVLLLGILIFLKVR